MAEGAVLAPFFGEFDRRFLQVAGMFLKLAFKTFEQSDSVGGRAGETGNDFIVVEPARFASGMFHDMIAHGYLAIGDEYYFAVLTHAQNRGSVHQCVSLGMRHRNIIPLTTFRSLNSCEHTGFLLPHQGVLITVMFAPREPVRCDER